MRVNICNMRKKIKVKPKIDTSVSFKSQLLKTEVQKISKIEKYSLFDIKTQKEMSRDFRD